MTDTYNKLAQTELTALGTAVLIYTAPATSKVVVKHIRLVNQTILQANAAAAAASTAVQMWQKTGAVVPPAQEFLILPSADISEGGWAEFEGTIILAAGEQIYASVENSTIGTTRDVSITLYGLEMTP